jgi:hypothetical protein
MDGEKQASQPRQRKAKPGQQTPEKEGAGEMQADVGEMIAERVGAPKVPLHPLHERG